MNTPDFFKSYPEPPEEISASNAIARMLDGLGYRLYLMREGTLGYEYPDTFEERISTRWGIRNLEANYGDTIGFDDYMENCRRLKEEKDGG